MENNMDQKSGKLLPTGKTAPERKVQFTMSHKIEEHSASASQRMQHTQPIVHQISCEDGQSLPPGDYDLIVGETLIRLKHKAGNPEWLVLSSNA